MTGQEEEQEKQRVAGLTAFAKEQELRKLNREIARLQMVGLTIASRVHEVSFALKKITFDVSPRKTCLPVCLSLFVVARYKYRRVVYLDGQIQEFGTRLWIPPRGMVLECVGRYRPGVLCRH